MKSEIITIYYRYDDGPLFQKTGSRTLPVFTSDKRTVASLIDAAEKELGRPIIVQSVKKYTTIETDLSGILSEPLA